MVTDRDLMFGNILNITTTIQRGYIVCKSLLFDPSDNINP